MTSKVHITSRFNTQLWVLLCLIGNEGTIECFQSKELVNETYIVGVLFSSVVMYTKFHKTECLRSSSLFVVVVEKK